MKKINIEFNQEQADYLQRLGVEVDSKVFLIDRMFANHASDTDTALFDSIPFKHYMSEYEKAYTEWELAKKDLENTILKPEVKKITGVENPLFNWKIDDYLSGECEITLL